MATAELTVTANLAGLREELSKIKGISADAATEMVAELNKSIKASEKAAKQAANATKKAMDDTRQSAKAAAAATADVGDKIGKFGSNAGKVAGVLDLVVPGLGGVARGAADIADGFEIAALGGTRLLAVLGPVAAAVAVGAAAYQYLASELEAVNQKNEEAARLATETIARTKEITRLTRDLADEEALATGAITEEEIAVRNRTSAIRDAYSEQIKYLEGKKREAAAAANGKGLNTAEAEAYRRAAAELDDLTAKQNDQIDSAEGLTRARYAGIRADERKAESERRLAEQQRASEQAARAAEQAEREREQSRAAYTRAVLDYAAGMERLTANQSSFLSEEEKLRASGEQRIQQLRELTQQVEYLGLTESEAAAARAAGAQAILDAEADLQAQLAQIRQAAREEEAEKATAAREAEAAAALENAQLIAQGIGAVGQGLDAIASNSASTLGDLQEQLASQSETLTMTEKKALEERVQAQRAAAIRAFEVAKAAKLAEAIINTAAAVASSLPNFVAAGAAAAVGGAQVATIAAQQPAFHAGGIVGAPPDEVNARLVRGEGVLSRSGVNAIGGEQAVRAANAGIQQTPTVVAINQYRHQVFRPFIRDHLRMGGDLTDALRGTRTVGMREAL
jgi:hypothetical protein